LRLIFSTILLTTVCHAQSLEETKAYIVSETAAAMNPAEQVVVVGFKDLKLAGLTFMTVQKSPLDGKARSWLFPINEIDVFLVEDSYGMHLRAKAREGAPPLKCYTQEGGTPIPYANIIAAGANPTKMRKLEKAFNHLIELVTGRKELF